jgi:methionine-S-sulfoxide reductase
MTIRPPQSPARHLLALAVLAAALSLTGRAAAQDQSAQPKPVQPKPAASPSAPDKPAASPGAPMPADQPAPDKNADSSKPKLEKALFGAGCFWGVEHIFRKDVPGVVEAVSGYAGGKTANPTYEQVCDHDTGHAEVVLVTFDPAKVSYEKLVDAFFRLHDPTQVNRQGPDIGDQYRSVIFYYTPEQKKTAEEVKARRATKHTKPIATTIEPAPEFYKAEEYHQKYYIKHNKQPYCHVLRPD